jgi:hypothetical protein
LPPAARGTGLNVRAGVHTGEVEFRPDDVVGLAVSIAKRICDLAGPGEVLVSETVKGHIVGSGIAMSEQGTHVLKGVPETWRLFAVESVDRASSKCHGGRFDCTDHVGSPFRRRSLLHLGQHAPTRAVGRRSASRAARAREQDAHRVRLLIGQSRRAIGTRSIAVARVFGRARVCGLNLAERRFQLARRV